MVFVSCFFWLFLPGFAAISLSQACGLGSKLSLTSRDGSSHLWCSRSYGMGGAA